VFEHDVEQQVRAVLTQAVDDVNSNPHLLPGIRLHVDLEFFPAYDSFAASRAGNLPVHGRSTKLTGATQLPTPENRTCWPECKSDQLKG